LGNGFKRIEQHLFFPIAAPPPIIIQPSPQTKQKIRHKNKPNKIIFSLLRKKKEG
jgi:hypothetical protein